MKQLTIRLLMLLVVAAVALVSLRATGFSDASYVITSTSRASVTAATDWTPPTVAVTDPGASVKGVVNLAATATDGETGVGSVILQVLAPGASTWVTLCATATAPYTCVWDTRTGTDGLWDIRARATDRAGYTTVSEVVETVVANTVLVVLPSPGEVVRGTIPLSARVYNGALLPWLVTVQYAPAGTTTWKTVCSGLTSPFSCNWVTTSLASDSYDLRAVATFGLTSVASAVVSDVLVDNTAPTIAVVDPGSPLRGTVTFSTTAADAHSGIAQVVIQRSTGGGAWQPLCTITTEPFSCRYATTALADGTYSLRALATDVAGNATTSATVGNRVVDNTVSSISVDDPGPFLSGTVTVAAHTNSTAGITSVRIQRAAAGTTAWTDLCTDANAPYSCTWETAGVPDGAYDLRALLLDGRGSLTTSAVVGGRVVDNRPLRAIDVQSTNGEGTPGRIDDGDVLTLTYSEQVALETIRTGWNGAALPVTVRVRDGNLIGLGNRGDTLDVLSGGAPLPLGSVALRQDYVKSRKSLSVAATLTAATITANGAPRTEITLRIGATPSGSLLPTVSTPGSLEWSPSAAARSLTGNACSSVPATESGAQDRDF